MQHSDKPIIDQPVEGFGAEESFFSRTDERGVIQSGNSVFVRLSEYNNEELRGAPHRIIRHPDMPKAVFYLMWKTLKSGKVFGGYVKNRSATGKYYWVFAIVIPVDGGYLSVRIKPSAKTFHAAQALYRQLIKSQSEAGFTPEFGAENLLHLLKDEGYESYENFMTEAINSEIVQRPDMNKGKVAESLSKFSVVAERLTHLRDAVHDVFDQFEMIKNFPINLNLAGARQGEAGRAIQVVAANYTHISSELMKSIEEMGAGLDQLVNEAYRGMMSFCGSVVLADAIERFSQEEPLISQEMHMNEMEIVRSAFRGFLTSASEDCARIEQDAARFAGLNAQLRKHLSALSVTRVTCRIEAAALLDDTGTIDEIAERLDDFQFKLSSKLDKIAIDCDTISSSVPKLDAAAL